jgi:hypothetical protein
MSTQNRAYSKKIKESSALILSILLIPVICFCAQDETVLDRPLQRVTGSTGQDVINACIRLSIPCGLEEIADDNLSKSSSSETAASSQTARGLFDKIVSAHPSYSWDFTNGVIHVRHKTIGAVPFENPLDRRIPKLVIKNRLSLNAMQDVLKAAGIRAGLGLAGKPPRYAFVSLTLENVTVREALDRIAKADGKVAWHFTYSRDGKQNHYGLIDWHITDGTPLFGSSK